MLLGYHSETDGAVEYITKIVNQMLHHHVD